MLVLLSGRLLTGLEYKNQLKLRLWRTYYTAYNRGTLDKWVFGPNGMVRRGGSVGDTDVFSCEYCECDDEGDASDSATQGQPMRDSGDVVSFKYSELITRPISCNVRTMNRLTMMIPVPKLRITLMMMSSLPYTS